MELESFLARFVALTEYFDATVSPVKRELYYAALKDIPDDEWIVLTNRIIRELKPYGRGWFPSVAEILELHKPKTLIADTATSQAYLVIKTIRQIGSYGKPKFDNPKTQKIVMQRGWKSICLLKADDEKWFVKNFVEEYQDMPEERQMIGYEKRLQIERIQDNSR